MWIADWSHARAAGDGAMVKRAIAAMATGPRWAILREMATQCYACCVTATRRGWTSHPHPP
jgi:hypothetical protein